MKSNEMTCRRLLSPALLISAQSLLVFLFTFIQGSSSLTHEELFPSLQEEYDHKILDPKTIHGSPYGGFARASRSRLAALPLTFLATLDDEAPYMTVADGEGREFICKTYKEDEVASVHLKSSLFDPAVPRSAKEKERVAKQKDTVVNKKKAEADAILKRNNVARVFDAALKGVCAEHREGYWTYEWCFGQAVRQFHVHRIGHPRSSVTLLGTYAGRTVKHQKALEHEKWIRHAVLHANSKSDLELSEEHAKEYALERFLSVLQRHEVELATVKETYTKGDMCDVDETTREPRTTTIQYRCCSPHEMKNIFRNQRRKPSSDLAVIVRVEEPSLCNYELVICTSLLCHHTSAPASASAVSATSSKNIPSVYKKTHIKAESTIPANESVQEVVDRTLDGLCLQTNTNEWWNYEFCYDRHVRQFNEAQVLDPMSGVTSRQVQSQYILGYYDEDEDIDIAKADEYKHVVNLTVALDSSTSKISSYGNGAYFPVEYTGGEICTDTNNHKDGVPRSTTVRYFCGPHYELKRVEEDVTCHYVADVTIPDLCQHALFQKPVEHKNVMKCLPV